jgi:L-threonylcarbamoyladenylate synthase
MSTPVLDVRDLSRAGDALARAVQLLRAGGLVAFPTETVYGLAANALDDSAVQRLFAAKGRPANNPLIVHLAGTEQVGLVTSHWPEVAARLAQRFWPGPLTLVLPRGPNVPTAVTAGGPTVAIRVPAHRVAHALLTRAGVPLAAPSANRSTRLSPTRAEHVLADLDGRIDLILDGGPAPGGIESTVLDLTSTPPRLLRPGLISPAEIEALIGPITRPAAARAETVVLPSPGMLSRHYAPRTPLVAVEGDAEPLVRRLCAAGARIGWVTLLPQISAPVDIPGCTVVPTSTDPASYAAMLYDILHGLDASGLEHIIVSMPPDTEEWLGVRDRLRRASS